MSTARNKECHYCGQMAESWDHIVPKARGGLTRRFNMVPACHECNGKKKARWPTCECVTCQTAIRRYHEGERLEISKGKMTHHFAREVATAAYEARRPNVIGWDGRDSNWNGR